MKCVKIDIPLYFPTDIFSPKRRYLKKFLLLYNGQETLKTWHPLHLTTDIFARKIKALRKNIFWGCAALRSCKNRRHKVIAVQSLPVSGLKRGQYSVGGRIRIKRIASKSSVRTQEKRAFRHSCLCARYVILGRSQALFCANAC